jgi:hypothetical protein
VYASIHVIGWNFEFPTTAEMILWRVCSMFLFGNTVAFLIFETSTAWYRTGRWQRFFCRIFWKTKLKDVEKATLAREAARLPKTLPLRAEFWSIFPLACTYAAARLYLIVGALPRAESAEYECLPYCGLGDVHPTCLRILPRLRWRRAWGQTRSALRHKHHKT